MKLNSRDVKDNDSNISGEPEMIKAFRDTWELGIHSYLSYLRDRLVMARELLTESGSVFVQISDENLHLVRNLLDEVFGSENFVSTITFQTKVPLRNKFIANVSDYILWYSKDKEQFKYRPLYEPQLLSESPQFSLVELIDGEIRPISTDERNNPSLLPKGSKVFTSLDLSSAGRTESCVFDYQFQGKIYSPTRGKSWKTNQQGMKRLDMANRLYAGPNALRYKLYHDDFPVKGITNLWNDSVGVSGKVYVVQTDTKPIQRCILMTTDPGDLVLDPTCGSGTTAYVAEQWGRRWITIDTSRIALNIAKKRLTTALFPYYKTYDDGENHNIRQGFVYKEVPHITVKTVAQNLPSEGETLYDQPEEDKKRIRVSGPFTVETLQSLDVS
jgi:adenine-specific DNA-methyltransferase